MNRSLNRPFSWQPTNAPGSSCFPCSMMADLAGNAYALLHCLFANRSPAALGMPERSSLLLSVRTPEPCLRCRALWLRPPASMPDLLAVANHSPLHNTAFGLTIPFSTYILLPCLPQKLRSSSRSLARPRAGLICPWGRHTSRLPSSRILRPGFGAFSFQIKE